MSLHRLQVPLSRYGFKVCLCESRT